MGAFFSLFRSPSNPPSTQVSSVTQASKAPKYKLRGLKANETPHEFTWKLGGKQVILTGTFDNWTKPSHHEMFKRDDGTHRLVIGLDPEKVWQFKFVVDGVWRCSLDYATVQDGVGNVNNVLYPE